MLKSAVRYGKVHVATYNVLCSHLSQPDYYVNCDPNFLCAEYRFSLLLSKLESEIAKSSIICLQEVSVLWAQRLKSHIEKFNYSLISCHYGNYYNGNMGCAVLVPLNSYSVLNVDVSRVSNTKTSVQITDAQREYLKYCTYYLNLKRKISSWQSKMNGVKQWHMAQQKPNEMINVELMCKQQSVPFVVGTYHMPCHFHSSPVMTIHCALAAQLIQRLAKDRPYVLTGDFNVKPSSAMYKMLTEGGVDVNNPEMPHLDIGDSTTGLWAPIVAPMRSAYRTASGSEPNFTNNAHRRNEQPFIDTIDYIFISNHWNVESVQQLPHRDQVTSSQPTEHEPSDHLLLSANLSISKAFETINAIKEIKDSRYSINNVSSLLDSQ